jgi:SPP1 gp7 family putative phage head morphogenesis protein
MEYFLNKSMWITGVMKEDILKAVKSMVFDGIKSGLTTADVIKNLEGYFSKYDFEDLDDTDVSAIPGRLQTIVRTNMNDAYNQGRLAEYQDPELEGYVVAYEYSSIIDSRTTDICDEDNLDGRIYAADDPIWSQITPPNHFNCRSTILPIVQGEQYELSEPPAIMPDKGFGG